MEVWALFFKFKFLKYTKKLFLAGMPSVEEVCQTFGLQDVTIDYTDADFQNLTTYKLFQQHVRPILAKENPKVVILIILLKI